MEINWKRALINDVFIINPSKKTIRDILDDNDNVSFVPMEDLGILKKDLNLKKEKKLKEVISNYTYFADGDLLLAKITPCFENGKMGIANNLKNGVGFGSSEYIVFRSKGQILAEYIFYFLSRQSFRDIGKRNMSGTVGHKRLEKEFVHNHQIFYPELVSEQKRIVEILDEVFADIEKAKINAEKNLQNVKKFFESYLWSVFAKSRPHWEAKRFDEVCVLQRGFDLPTRLRIGGDFPLVSSNGITDRINLFKVKSPGVVTGRSGTIGKVHFIQEDFWPLNTALYVKEFHGNFEKCVFYFLTQFDLRKYSSGAGVPTLNRNNVHGEMVTFPKSLSEQKLIVTKLEALSAEVEKLESIYKQRLVLLDELKESVLKKAFAGEL